MTAPPVLRVAGGARGALAPGVLAGLTSEQLLRFLAERRWFGAKGRTPRRVAITDVIPLPWRDGAYAVAVVEVDLGEGEPRRYQVPLAAREAGSGRVPADGGRTDERRGNGDEVPGSAPRAILATVETDGASGLLFDATEDAEFRRQLGEAFEKGAAFGSADSGAARWVIEPVRAGTESGDAPPASTHPRSAGTGQLPASRLGAAEQSNTSIIYGDEAILKLFRTLEAGENPDVEISRFLATRTRFRNTPPLLGVIRLERAPRESGVRESSVAGMLARFLPGSGDAWAHALARVRAYLGAPTRGDPPNPFADEARELGRVTRALHEALASDESDPAFAPMFATGEDAARWAEGTRRSVTQAFELLAVRLDALDATSRAPARALLARREATLARVGELAESLTAGPGGGAADAGGGGDSAPHAPDLGLRIRHHGDYHLGQVLRTRDGEWMIIDFEGEPARPLAERRARHSPLRDVAGMMRSFAYAAASGAMEAGGLGADATLEIRAARWERDARAAFLDGYARAAADESGTLLPDTPEGTTALLTLFEIEKIFYELAYELNNRPAWAWIPLRGIAKLF